MSEAMESMPAFTQLTDGVFWYIKFSKDPELKKAREILEKVERRELYKCIGRSLPTERKITLTKDDIPRALITQMNLVQSDITPQDLLVDFVTFNYGKGEANPIDAVWFYRKSQPDKAVRIKKEQVSEMLPKTFQEFEVRLYLRKEVSDELRKQLCSTFDEFCGIYAYQLPPGADATDVDEQPSNERHNE